MTDAKDVKELESLLKTKARIQKDVFCDLLLNEVVQNDDEIKNMIEEAHRLISEAGTLLAAKHPGNPDLKERLANKRSADGRFKSRWDLGYVY